MSTPIPDIDPRFAISQDPITTNVLLRRLENAQNKLNRKIQRLMRRYKDAPYELKLLQDQQKHICTVITAIENKSILVSDHAYLRYIERIENRDIEALKKLIVPDDLMQKIVAADFADGQYGNETHIVVVGNRSVRSVLSPWMKKYEGKEAEGIDAEEKTVEGI